MLPCKAVSKVAEQPLTSGTSQPELPLLPLTPLPHATFIPHLQASALQAQLPAVRAIVASQQSKVSDMQGQLGSVTPDVTPYLASLAGLGATYASLPQPPRQLALDAQAAIEDIVGSMQQVAGRHFASARLFVHAAQGRHWRSPVAAMDAPRRRAA